MATINNSQRRSRKKKKNNTTAITIVASAIVIVCVALTAIFFVLPGKKTDVAVTIEERTTIHPAPATEVVVETEPPETETTTEEGTTTAVEDLATETMYVMGNRVNVRREPSAEAEIAGELSQDDEIPIIEKNEEWTNVIFNGEVCYVSSDYLTDDRDWKEHLLSSRGYKDGESIALNPSWEYADYSAIHDGTATMYLAKGDRKGITVGVNAGHGTSGGGSVKTWCHPDKTPKVTGGTTAAGETKAIAVSYGMNFIDGTREAKVTLKEAMLLKDLLLANGYDVLMIRESDDIQLDNVARTVICNNVADCHIAIHWDGDGLDYDKGCFYMSVPNGIKYLPSVEKTWEKSEALGNALIQGLSDTGNKIFSSGSMDMDLTQTSYSTVPSVDIELGNQSSDHGDEKLSRLAEGLCRGIGLFFGQ